MRLEREEGLRRAVPPEGAGHRPVGVRDVPRVVLRGDVLEDATNVLAFGLPGVGTPEQIVEKLSALKAKSIIGAAKKILGEFGGEIPQTLEELVTEPSPWTEAAPSTESSVAGQDAGTGGEAGAIP